MAIFARPPTSGLRVVLELSPQADATARGEVDGVPVELGRDGRLRLPVEGRWPGAVATVARPKRSDLGARMLRNRASRPAWMEEAFARPEVRACVRALADDPLAVDVSERALLVRWTGAADGPAVRRATRGLIALARALPQAMQEVVEARVAADPEARRQASLARAAASLRRPPTEAALQEALRRRLDLFDGSALFAGLGGVLLLAVFTYAPPRLSLVLGGCWFALAWASAFLRCPRCRRPLLSWTRVRRGPIRRACAHCGLRAAEVDRADENGGADQKPAPPRSKPS